MDNLSDIIDYLLEQGDAKKVQFKAGDVILREGEEAVDYYYILDGSCEVYTTINGDEKILDLIKPGEFFGEAGLFEGHKRSANVRAKTDIRCANITRDVFKTANVDLQRFLLVMLNNVSVRLANTNRLFVAMIEVGKILANHEMTDEETAGAILTLLKEKLQAASATFVRTDPMTASMTILAGDKCTPGIYVDELKESAIREIDDALVLGLKNPQKDLKGMIILKKYTVNADANVRNVLLAVAEQIAASFDNKNFEAAEKNKERLQQRRF